MTGIETTVLFTDIEASTERWDRFPDAMRHALERHDEVMRAAFSSGTAHILKHTGDGMIVADEDAAALLVAAVVAQQELASVDWSDVGGLRVRMGLHRGRFHGRDDDLFGADMNLAARIMGGAAGGQIVLSAGTIGAASAPAGCRMEELGRFRFRGVHEPVAVLSVQYPGSDAVYPPYRSSEADLGNLVAPLDRLVGRDAELEQIGVLLRSPGIVTLVGPGGVGKTSTAITVAASARALFPDGLWFADLTTVSSHADVAPRLARVLGLTGPSEGSPETNLAHALSTHSLLLVIDGCEHLLSGVREALRDIVGAHPRATILATSQEAIGHPAEQTVALAPLGMGDGQSAAVDLFVERARAIDPGFTPDRAQRAEILGLCRSLDGLPLAIELAASRTAALGLADITAHLGQRFRLLESPGSGRHDALERTIAWSHDLLDEAERQVLRRAAVFEGRFDLAQAAVAADLDTLDTADVLARLVSKSMLSRQGTGATPSLRFLESLRQYALGRLDAESERDATLDRITVHLTELARSAGRSIDGPDQLEWFDRLDRSMPSIRIAVERLLERDAEAALDLLVGLYPFWMERTGLREALRWLTSALGRAVHADPGLASRALADASTMAYFCGDLGLSRTLSERSIAVAEEHGLPGRPSALLRLAALQAFAGDGEAAQISGEQALATLDVDHQPPEPPEAMGAVGAFLALVGQPDRGIEICQTAIDRHRESSPTTQASDLVNLAYAYQLVDPARAVDTYLLAAERARAAGSRFSAATAAMGAGLCLRAAGRHDDALVVLAEALPLARDLGMRHEAIVMVKVVSRILRGRGSIDGDVLLLIADREQRAGEWEGSPTLGRRERRTPAEIAAEIGADYADIAAAAAELELDEAIDIISRIAGQARVAVSTGGQWPSTSMGTSGSSEAP